MTRTNVGVELPDGGCGECELFDNDPRILESPEGPPLALSLLEGTDPYATGVCTLSGHQCSEDSPACVLKVEEDEGIEIWTGMG